MRRAGIYLGLLAALIILILFLFDRIVLLAAAKYAGLELSYTRSHYAGSGQIALNDFSVRDPKRGLGLYAKKAVIGLGPWSSPKAGFILRFRFDDAYFKRSPTRADSAHDAISRMSLIPFEGSWVYSAVSGVAVFSGRTVQLKDFLALSSEIKLGIESTFYPNDSLDAHLKISFSKSAMEKLPEELTSVILEDDGDWKTISLRLQGNYRSPSIQLSGKLFRLNIRSQ